VRDAGVGAPARLPEACASLDAATAGEEEDRREGAERFHAHAPEQDGCRAKPGVSTRERARRLVRNSRWSLIAVALCACDGPSTVVVDNGFADTFTVFRAWWQTTDFPTPVAPSTSSAPLRTVPGTDFAWAVLQQPDAGFVAVRSTQKLALEKVGDELHISIAPASVVGLCGSSGALSNVDAATSERIFPDELSGTYDPSTCTFLPSH
jgi:hypothetical protein